MLVVTTEVVPGRPIGYVIGEVMGVTARATNPFTEGLKTLDGRSKTPAPSLLRWRREAIAEMIAEAKRLGADAVVGMKFDHRQITDSWMEICAYGTAVRFVVYRPQPLRSSVRGSATVARGPRHQLR